MSAEAVFFLSFFISANSGRSPYIQIVGRARRTRRRQAGAPARPYGRCAAADGGRSEAETP